MTRNLVGLEKEVQELVADDKLLQAFATNLIRLEQDLCGAEKVLEGCSSRFGFPGLGDLSQPEQNSEGTQDNVGISKFLGGNSKVFDFTFYKVIVDSFLKILASECGFKPISVKTVLASQQPIKEACRSFLPAERGGRLSFVGIVWNEGFLQEIAGSGSAARRFKGQEQIMDELTSLLAAEMAVSQSDVEVQAPCTGEELFKGGKSVPKDAILGVRVQGKSGISWLQFF